MEIRGRLRLYSLFNSMVLLKNPAEPHDFSVQRRLQETRHVVTRSFALSQIGRLGFALIIILQELKRPDFDSFDNKNK
ncbi:hypothetical protein HanXRQr2_Chr02g0050881 [Helianthus annuus]|uniref:Uncharacterized protein n=1 Tax=Helianthus annuus TaxID=4232 RepID=A0A9K3NYK4_HELAN|nr:hypothetical protein HanXRQr2_Chr02g0050881 [Helianthus annuus]KAJ0950623.1 hypothetical protein HanPSC8_Chr02g0050371 [Helianthus annuus]